MKALKRIFRFTAALAFILVVLGSQNLFAADVRVYAEGIHTDNTFDVFVYADSVGVDLVSFGVTLTYDPQELSLTRAEKNEAIWFLGGDAGIYPYVDPDTGTAGEVTLVGGKLDSDAPGQGVSGTRVLLGKVVFEKTALLEPALSLSLGSGEGFRNFVTSDIQVLDGDPQGIEFGPVDIITTIAAFSSSAYQVEEGQGTFTATVTLSDPSEKEITLSYTEVAGSAAAGIDYAASSGVLTFSPGETSKTVTISVINDSLDEDAETIHLTLSEPDQCILGDNSDAVLTIVDDDEVFVAFSNPEFELDENAGKIDIPVTLSTESVHTLTVTYATGDDTAVAGSDYRSASGTLTFAPGETGKIVSVTVLDDPVDELTETLTLTLSDPEGCNLGAQSTATLSVIDDDVVQAAFSTDGFSGTEADNSIEASVTLSASSPHTVTVNYATGGGTATAGSDYTAASGTVTFNPGETVKTVSVPVLDDSVDEASETVMLSLSDPVNGALGAQDTAALTIDDNDAVTVAFSAAAFRGDETSGTITASVELSIPSEQTLKVKYTTGDGTALAGSDYTAASGTLSFAPGETSKPLAVTVLDDGEDELTEKFTITLSAPENCELGMPSAAEFSIDDDDVVQAAFSADNLSAAESGGSIDVTVTLSAPSPHAVTVNYAASDGSAAARRDYAAASGRLTFDPGETRQTFSVLLLDNDVDEAPETVILTLSDPVHSILGALNVSTLTITDDDPVSFAFAAATGSGSEASGAITAAVNLSGESERTLTVNYATGDGTALAGSDYTAAAGTLIFAPSETSKPVAVTILDDAADELEETLKVILSGPVNGELGSPGETVLSIVDDDEVSVFFPGSAFSVAEDLGQIDVPVHLSAPSPHAVTVRYATAGGSAAAGNDYTPASDMLTIEPGTLSAVITVFIAPDRLDETDETFSLMLSEPVKAALTDVNVATVTISDDDTASLSDAILVARALADIPVGQGILDVADADGDGRIGMADLVYILQKISGARE